MITSEALLELSEANVNLAQMRAMLKLLAKAQKADEDRRAKTRARVQKHREINGAERYGNVTCNATETNNPSPFPFPLSSPPEPPPIIPQTHTPTRNHTAGAKKVGSRISDEWHVGEIEFSEAIKIGLTRDQIQFEGERFRDFWTAKTKDATKLDWLATWRNWCRSAFERSKPRFPSQNHEKPKSRNQLHQEAVDRELAKIINGEGHDEFPDNVIDLAQRDYRFTA